MTPSPQKKTDIIIIRKSTNRNHINLQKLGCKALYVGIGCVPSIYLLSSNVEKFRY